MTMPSIPSIPSQYSLGGSTSPLPDNQTLSNDDLSNLSQPNQDPADDYSSLARQDLDKARSGGITKDQLDALHNHEAANMWTSLFLNFIGATNGIKDGAKYAEPLRQRVDQERQGLMQQQQLANQQADRATQEQRLGLQDVELSNAKRKQGMLNQPLNTFQKAALYSLADQGKLQNYDKDDIENATQADYENLLSPLKDVNQNQLKQLQLQNLNLNTQARNKTLVPYQGEDGNIQYAFANKLNGDVNPIDNTVLPQNIRINSQQSQTLAKNLLPSVETHRAIQNYDTALEGLSPQEADQADNLARRQISAIAGKFDQGVKSNAITNVNQLLSSISKLEQTGEFNTPDNPAIGQAAFRRVKSALDFAASTQAGKVRPSNFATQFSLGNSFGANIAGQPVPTEKIDELKHQAQQTVGGAIQDALVGASDQKLARDKAKELFGNSLDDYLNSYNNIHGPGFKPNTQNNTNSGKVLGKDVMSAQDYLNSLK